MKRLLGTILSMALAAIMLAGVPASRVEASYWGTYFDFSEQTVTVARGTNKRITMYTEYTYSIDVLNATSKGTAAYVVGREYGRDVLELRVGADETSSRVRFMVYINDDDHHDKSARDFIYVNVSNKSDKAATSAASVTKAASTSTAKAAGTTITVADNTDYWAFQQAIADAVTAAPANARLTIHTGSWNSLYITSLDAIAARTDVTITVNWVQDGAVKTFTMPAGTVTSTLRDENGFLGFEHLQRVFG